jgi:excisionase family DNA binding protein
VRADPDGICEGGEKYFFLPDVSETATMLDGHTAGSLSLLSMRSLVLPRALTSGKIEYISCRGENFLVELAAMIEDRDRRLGNPRDGMHPTAAEGRRARHEPPELPKESPTHVARSAVPFAQRLACTVAEACEATGLGRTKLYELIGDGRLDTTTIGRRRLVLVRSLFSLLAAVDK